MSKKKSIFQLLTEKPWEKDQIEEDNDHQGQSVNLSKHALSSRTSLPTPRFSRLQYIHSKVCNNLVHTGSELWQKTSR